MPRILSVDETLTAFFADRRRGAVGIRRDRLTLDEKILRDVVERSADLVLTDDEQVLLALEEQFTPSGAVARVMPAEGLLLVLELHLAYLEQRPGMPADRHAQLSTCDALTRHLTFELRRLDVAPAVHRIRVALDTCAESVERESRAARRGWRSLAQRLISR